MRLFLAVGLAFGGLFIGATTGSDRLLAQRGASPARPARDMAELLMTLRDATLTQPKKYGLTGQTFSGEVEVLEVQDVGEPTPDRPFDVIISAMPAKRIIVEVAGGTAYFLVFQTTDVARAAALRKGDKVSVSGQLVKFVQHRVGFNNKPDEWLLFDSTVRGAMAGASVTLAHQQPPRFSGRWINGVLENPAAVTGLANRRGSQLQVGLDAPYLTIRQDAKVIEIIEDLPNGGSNKLVYHLDGSAAKNSFRVAPKVVKVGERLIAEQPRLPAEYVSNWKDGRLVSAITVQVPGEDGPRRYEETISLGPDGTLSVRMERVGSGDSRTMYYKKE